MEVMVYRHRVRRPNRCHVEFQTVNHDTCIGIGLASLWHSAVSDDDRLSFSDVERDERRAGLGIALGGRSKLHASSHHVAVNPHFDVGLRLVLVGVVVVSL